MRCVVFDSHSEGLCVNGDVDYAAVVAAPVGLLGIRLSGGQLLGIDFSPPVTTIR